MALNIQRELIKSIKEFEYFSIIAVGTIDIILSADEQFSSPIRFVNSKFEVFTGLYNTSDSKASNVF